MQIGGHTVQQRLIASNALQQQQQAQPLRGSATQKIIVHQLPASSQQNTHTQLTNNTNNVSLPQQIIITTQPQQPAPQPAQISLQQLQQVSWCLSMRPCVLCSVDSVHVSSMSNDACLCAMIVVAMIHLVILVCVFLHKLLPPTSRLGIEVLKCSFVLGCPLWYS